MALRNVIVGMVLVIGVLAGLAWHRWVVRAPATGEAPAGPSGPAAGSQAPAIEGHAAPAGDPGVAWNPPPRWAAELASGMRLATYVVPARSGSAAARCAVYYFGLGQGGSVESNIERWIGEFEHPAGPRRSRMEVAGLRVSRLEVSGTYQAHAGGSGEAAGGGSDWALIGAIVEGPNGSLFFKLTGPSAAVKGAAREFDALLASLRKE